MYLKKIAIVIVNYRQPYVTIECMESIRQLNNTDWSAIIVDNNSGDNSYEILQENISDAIIIPSDENNGFAAGCNIGIRYAMEHGAEYVLLLNNDTIVDSMLIDQLLYYSDDNTVTVPKIYYYNQPDIIWYAGGYISFAKGTAFHYGENEMDKGQYDEVREINFATGCCMLIPKNVVINVPMMDEAYFLYFEDSDYSFALKKYGFRILYCSKAKLWHKVSASTGKNSRLSEYYVNRNRLYFIKKYHFSVLTKGYIYVTRLIKYLRGILTNSNEQIIRKSIADYWNGKMGKQEY